ncbi:hypothetical protein DE146DRAFT_635775 [Phaeosphaeria sp. MPI-PUGE-AT-0046c]|nr:hypothetical protein DE146DRAFT_635775 [Phaeosphaeria sp. MPI-PUGE-AT-0046c]
MCSAVGRPGSSARACSDVVFAPSLEMDRSKHTLARSPVTARGFKCFIDDDHAVHKERNYGQCRSQIYCTHDSATVVRIAASSDTVAVAEHTDGQNSKASLCTDGKATVAEILENITLRTGAGSNNCESAPVDVCGGCKIVVSECVSTDTETMGKMVHLLLVIYENNNKLFAVNDQDYKPRPNRGGSIRGYNRGVKMPQSFTMSESNIAPPKADGSLDLG